MSKPTLELRRDALKIVWQQLEDEIPWGFFRGPRTIFLFVCSEQNALTFLTRVDFASEVNDVRQFATHCLVVFNNFVHWLGHEVVVFHCQHWQFETTHTSNFSRPQTASIHNMLSMNCVVFVGDDIPCSVWSVVESGYPRVGVHLGAAIFCADCVCVRDAVWVNRAFVFVVQRTDEVFLFEQRVECFRFLH